MADASNSSPNAVRPSSVLYTRPKQTKRSVLLADAFANWGIRIGGMLIIIAVFTIMVFLVYVSLPLLKEGQVGQTRSYAVAVPAEKIIDTQMDEHQTVVVRTAASGKAIAFHARTGTSLSVTGFDFATPAAPAAGTEVPVTKAPAAPVAAVQSTSFARTLRGDDVVFGFADGSVRTGRIDLHPQIIPANQLPANLRKLDDRDSTDGTAIYSIVPGQFRKSAPQFTLDPAVQVAPVGTAIIEADYRIGGTAERPLRTFVTLDATGHIRLSQAYTEINMMTGEASTQLTNAEIPLLAAVDQVEHLLLNTPGTRVLVAMKDGTVYRFDTRDFNHPKLAETFKTLPAGVTLTGVSYLNAENSLIVGGSDGTVAIWFGVDRKSKDTTDGIVTTKVHANYDKRAAAITDIEVSQRTRLFSTTDAGGKVWIHHGTTDRTLLALPGIPETTVMESTVFGAKDDSILSVSSTGKVWLWQIEIPHPETTIQSLFGKVWYEGYGQPEYVWQSTAGTDAAEPKLSLIPLIFGTFKAAIYSLLLAIPIGLFAAAYTSEFLHPRTRSVVKPVMELMATLPSVVIGFVAALVLSPIVENWIAAIVIAFGVIPLTLITVSFLWQLLPLPIFNLLDGVPKLIAYLLAIIGAVWLSQLVGPLIETLFFGGDFRKWTNGEGSGQPFLFLILVPAAFVVALLVTRPIFNLGYRQSLRSLSPIAAASRELFGWLLIFALAFGLAFGASIWLSTVGYDARGGLVDTYVQRNALVVAFAMAFAIIPIIYTISEDSLNAVPGYLRSGSLACGATRWQTTAWIVLPTAASGIFSAIMIGLGRAVGETMIVVMATGNTPILDINIFNGLRTLSANINVELPEAVRDSTLYRTLFLCALVLFAVTFVINTVAELVRQRYRRRAAQL
jgi:phosphate transport system permease protein